MNRRGFLQAILASATAPYVVTTAGVLMPVKRVITEVDDLPFSTPYTGSNLYRWVRSDRVDSYLAAGWNHLAEPWIFQGTQIMYITMQPPIP